jgi:quercetin dioxygenase-like cupin family protein
MKKTIDLYKIGEKIEFNDAREQTNGKRTEGTVTLAPGKAGPPPHRHMLQEEGFELISGSMIVQVNGREAILKPGDAIVVQPGEVHSFRNGSNTEEMVTRA